MTQVYISPAPFGEYRVRFQYDPTLVELLKDTVPPSCRRWSTDDKTWTVTEAYFVKAFAKHARTRGHTISGAFSGDEQQSRKASTPAPVGWAEALFDAVGPTRREVVFRVLTRVLHPDVATGSEQLMKDLNNARGKRVAQNAKAA